MFNASSWLYTRLVDLYWLLQFGLIRLLIPLISMAVRLVRCDNNTNNSSVWFYSDGCMPREKKLAEALIQAGFTVELLTSNSSVTQAYAQHFSGIKVFSSTWKATLFLLRNINQNQLVHVFVYGRYGLPWLLHYLGHKKWILDPYDVLAAYQGSHLEASSIKCWLERQCMSAAPAICCRNLELQLIKRRYGRILPPSIFFPEYPSSIRSSHNNQLRFHQTGIHSMIYGGGMYDQLMKPILELLNQQEYATLTLCASAQQVAALNGVQPFLKDGKIKHKGLVEYDEFMMLCQQHQVGVLLLDQSFQKKMRYAMANKLWDYVSAGLIPLIQKEHFCCWLLSRYGFLLAYCATSGHTHPKQGFNSADRLIMGNNIHRLINFYKDL